MRVALIDCEYNEGGARHPNPWIMKISSYYKQTGHQPSLVVSVKDPNSFDLIVVAKESNTRYLPPLSLLTLDKTRLIGKAFEKHKKYWDLPIEIYKARPDYGLYSFEFPSDKTNASFISISYKGEIIKAQKQQKEKRELAINYIIDKDLWESENLEKVLDELDKYNKIIFLEEVDIKKLKSMNLIKKFANLRLYNDQIKLKKVSSLEELEKTIFSVKEIQKIKLLSFQNIKYVTLPKDVPPQEGIKYYLDSIKAAAMMSKNSLVIDFLIPREDRFESAYLFKDLMWFNNKKESYFAYLLRSTGLDPAQAMSNITYWKKEPVSFIWKIYHAYEDVFLAGTTVWGGSQDKFVKEIKEGDAKRFYDLYIL